MRILKVAVVCSMALVMSACACHTKSVNGNDNITNIGDASPLSDVNFGFDSAALDAGAKDTLGVNAKYLAANPGVKVQVEGHADERGTNEYNIVLGAKRAQAAADYLRSLGVTADRLGTVSYGEELPLDPAHNEGAWAKNRRAHFKIEK